MLSCHTQSAVGLLSASINITLSSTRSIEDDEIGMYIMHLVSINDNDDIINLIMPWIVLMVPTS